MESEKIWTRGIFLERKIEICDRVCDEKDSELRNLLRMIHTKWKRFWLDLDY